MDLNWTPEDAEAWAETWREPHMRKGLDVMRHLSRPVHLGAAAQATNPQAGVDYTALAAQRAQRYEGRQEVLDFINSLSYANGEPPSPLSEPFSYAEETDDGE
jgi:hypothetical protein